MGSLEDLLDGTEPEKIDTTTPDGFVQYVKGDPSLTEESIRFMIYRHHDADKIRAFIELYVDILLESGELAETDREVFRRKMIDGYELTYNEMYFPNKTYGQMNKQFEKVKKQLQQPLQHSNSTTSINMLEQADGMYVVTGKSSKRITGFVIRPVYIVTHETVTLEEQVTTEGFGVFEIIIKHHKTQALTISRIDLRSYNFNTASSLREVLREKKVHGAFIYGADKDITLLGEYLFFETNATQRIGINAIGIKRLESGENVIVTPKKVFDTEGSARPDLVYVRDEVISIADVMRLEGLAFDEASWKQDVLPLFAENVLSLHKRSTMISILGWLMSIPFETTVRVDGNLGGFPHLMINGVNGGGKTALISALMSFLGYGTHPEIMNFGTQFANTQAIGTSYHIPVPFDEYRPHEWHQSMRNAVERLLRESYNKGFTAKGLINLSTRRFDYRNPMIIIGQMATSDQAIAERVIPVYVDVNFLRTKEAVKAKETLHLLSNTEYKAFWTGYMIWCAKQSTDEVLAVYEEAKAAIATMYPTLKEREVKNYAVVSLGLHFFKKLADEYGLNCHYTNIEIYDVVHTITEHAEVTLGNKVDELWRFLNDLAFCGNTYGNGKGTLFGIGKTVMMYQPGPDKKDVYGKNGERKAEIHGRKVLLVKISDAIQALHSLGVKNKYDEKMLMPIIMSYFHSAQTNNGDGLVLAPQGYRVAGGRYTAFHWDEVSEMFGFVEELQSDENFKHETEELVREFKQGMKKSDEDEASISH